MLALRIAMIILAALNLAFAGLTALVGGFADGGEWWQRVILMAVHPAAAIALLLLVALPRPAGSLVLLVAALLLVSVASDVYMGALLYQGVVRGDWALSLAFAAVPFLGLLYALLLLTRTPARPAAA